MPKEKDYSGFERCGHCGNTAPMEIVARYSQVSEAWDEKMSFSWNEGDVHEWLLCPACKLVTYRMYFWHDATMDPGDIEYETLYPAPARELLGLPPQVKRGYEAALRVRNIDPNAYAVLVGRVLELVCTDRAAEGRSLAQKLAYLAKRGEIPQNLVGCARHLKDLRNVGAHAVLGELTRHELPILDDLARSILEYVYTAPELASRAEKRLRELAEGKRPPDTSTPSKADA
jgi:hypothetical protein